MEHPPPTRTVQVDPGTGSTSWYILFHPQDRTYTLEDPQPKALTVVPLTYPAGWGDLSPPRLPPMVRVLVLPHPVLVNTFLALFGTGSMGFCTREMTQPPRGGPHPLPMP